MQLRTRLTICLVPTGNFQGSIEFMSVETGLKIVHRNYTKLPIPDSVIKKVNLLAERDKAEMGVMVRNGNDKKSKFVNEEYDPMQNENTENDNKINPDIPAEFPGPTLERDSKVDATMDPQNDEDTNIEAAEAEQN